MSFYQIFLFPCIKQKIIFVSNSVHCSLKDFWLIKYFCRFWAFSGAALLALILFYWLYGGLLSLALVIFGLTGVLYKVSPRTFKEERR